MSTEPINEQALHTAALWSVRLRDAQVTVAEVAQWRAAHPAHEAAWRRIEQLESRLAGLQAAPPAAVRQALACSGLSRRQLLRTLAGLGIAVPSAWLAVSHWHSGEYQTQAGEIKRFTLADGSTLLLNSDTVVDVEFGETARHIYLKRGELMIKTAPDVRTLSVSTRDGRFVALGTHFTVRLNPTSSQMALLAGQVAIENRAGERVRIAQPGEVWQLNPQGLNIALANGIDPTAWLQRRLILDNARLDEVLAELARQRSGWLRCDPAAGELKVSGVFVLDDTDQVLATLQSALPIRVRYRSSYWVVVELNRRQQGAM